MKPKALITRRVQSCTRDLLAVRAAVTTHAEWVPISRPALTVGARDAHALLVFPADRIDEQLLELAPRLQVVACAFRVPENIDVAACTRRGIWVTNVPHTKFAAGQEFEFELEAARNVLDVLNGDLPRGAVNQVALAAA
jgi:phosphonate dehydrogenase